MAVCLCLCLFSSIKTPRIFKRSTPFARADTAPSATYWASRSFFSASHRDIRSRQSSPLTPARFCPRP
eukprot:1986202-Rhodomonas_salina.2